MALPISRNFTYAPNDPVRSADLNDIQDQIISVFKGTRKREIQLAGAIAIAGAPSLNMTNISDAVGSFTAHVAFGGFDVGNRITEVLTHVLTNTSGSNVSVELWRQPRAGGAPVSVAGPVVSNAAGPFELVLAAMDHPILEDNLYYIELITLGPVVTYNYLEASYSLI